jgi:hypothetical protein
VDFGYLGTIRRPDWRWKLHALALTAVMSWYCYLFLTFARSPAGPQDIYDMISEMSFRPITLLNELAGSAPRTQISPLIIWHR